MSGRSETVADRANQGDHSRSPHEYAVDLFTESFLENYGDPELEDAILVAEKDYFFTQTNTSIDRIRQLGRPKSLYGSTKGDLDFAVIFLDDRSVEHFEFKETEDPDHNPNTSVREQGERMRETFDYLNNLGAEWEYEREVVFLDERTMDLGIVQDEHPSEYTEGYHLDEEVERRARNSEAFQDLDEHVFDGKFFHGTKIKEKER